MPSADEIRDVQRATWAGLSAGWEKWDSVIMDQLGPVGAAMIERLDIAEDQQHLDIAAGTGEPGLSIARLSPKGRVVLTDLVAEMLDIAARRARAQGIANVETKVCSADDLPFDDATFDSVSVRFGYMFFPDVAKATAEFARVLKPGGRLCSSVWVKPEENPWTTIAMQAIATEAVVAPPDPDGPNMFRCAAPGYVSALYEGAGLRDVAEWDVDVELVTRSPEQYWEMISEHVSLAVAALQQVDEPARERIRATRHCEGERVREGRQGPGSGRGAVHRGNETGRERHAPTRRRAILQRGLTDRYRDGEAGGRACGRHKRNRARGPRPSRPVALDSSRWCSFARAHDDRLRVRAQLEHVVRRDEEESPAGGRPHEQRKGPAFVRGRNDLLDVAARAASRFDAIPLAVGEQILGAPARVLQIGVHRLRLLCVASSASMPRRRRPSLGATRSMVADCP